MRWTVRRCGLSGVVALVAACSGNESSGPSAPPPITGSYMLNQPNLNLDGTMHGVTVSCSANGIALTITQTDTTFTGTHSAGTITCSAGFASVSDVLVTGTVINGTIDASGHIQFDLDTPDYRLTGTVSGNGMSGTATAKLTVGGSTITLTGDWTASRTSTSANANANAGSFSTQHQGRTAIEALSTLVR